MAAINEISYELKVPNVSFWNLYVVLHGQTGSSRKIYLKRPTNTSGRSVFNFTTRGVGKIEALEIGRGFSIFCIDNWHVDFVTIENTNENEKYTFEVNESLKPFASTFVWKTSLPQQNTLDIVRQRRRRELDTERTKYQLNIIEEGVPPQLLNVPRKQKFSWRYLLELLVTLVKLALVVIYLKVCALLSGKWRSLEEMEKFYPTWILTKPQVVNDNFWRDDINFGRQRLAGVNSSVIKVVRQHTDIPDNFPVQVEGGIENAIRNNRLFIVNYNILHDINIQRADGRGNLQLCAPVAWFYLNNDRQFQPLAIQLNHRNDNNPIFLPDGDQNTWMMAKMWFNNADSAYHQSVAHLGFTHFLMDSLSVVTHRHLSRSHPLFKLLAPHFLYLMAIDNLAMKVLIGPGQWVDQTMNIGRDDMMKLISKRMMTWRLDIDGTLPNDLTTRGFTEDVELPGYHFREDASKLYNIIKHYVSDYVDLYYGDADLLTDDWELQEWVTYMIKSPKQGGIGLKGVPVGDGDKITQNNQLVIILTSIIYTCSVGHASVNFQQYEEYGFPPNYPAYLFGNPPTTTEGIQEHAILQALPDKNKTISIMMITKLLSKNATNSLGNFETEYIHDDAASHILDRFRTELRELSRQMYRENRVGPTPYNWLNPHRIPNAISI